MAEQPVLEGRDPAPDPEVEPPARELVEHADLLDKADRVMERQARDEHPEPQALGLPRDGGEEDASATASPKRVAVVLGEVVAAKAGRVGLAQEGEPPS